VFLAAFLPFGNCRPRRDKTDRPSRRREAAVLNDTDQTTGAQEIEQPTRRVIACGFGAVEELNREEQHPHDQVCGLHPVRQVEFAAIRESPIDLARRTLLLIRRQMMEDER
jgi:hypothetical protein